MTEVARTYRVDIVEYERGWGPKIDHVKYFDSKESAKLFCKDFNSKDTSRNSPDWYVVANYIG